MQRKTRASKQKPESSISSSASVPAASSLPASKTRKFNETSEAPVAKKLKTVAETESDEESEREIDDSVRDPDYQSSSTNGSEDDDNDSLESFVNQATTTKSTPASNVARSKSTPASNARSTSTPASNLSRKLQSTPRIPVVTSSLPSGFKHYIIEGTANGNFCSLNVWLKVFKHMFKGF